VPQVVFIPLLLKRCPMLISKNINNNKIVAINTVKIMLNITKFMVLVSIQINASY
tara:strand:+ start:13205 stop:13369 length:165 start_codon:yes stop_codon:yes gene_type:complete